MLAVIGLAALVFAVVTSNALVAWVCIGASVLGVLLLIVDALRERRRPEAGPAEPSGEAEPAPDDVTSDAGTTDETSGTSATGEGTDQNFDTEHPDESTTDDEPAAQPADRDAEADIVRDDHNDN